ncbi:hypothetical protein ERW49_12080 [Aliivibrio finisterrensis]|uniref:Uncharacterized protein n=1 Tax=Aliivibrio finisterrensis TaxID=511998 RepID=A0A4Q5KIK3_9GAMM|nr:MULTISPECIES: hypothetical protein [Aliivibrio]MDD9175905.1 hypothetical protein [Aliivibrio sp. S3TY1]MDD9192841.1 hypothetical protein [Aliivibrio sp. S2TY2]RYU46028.1 hypothetical protein ERW49_12080 [Aliivibrio finisterrensis]
MLESLFINSLSAFGDDYKALCQHHYPTIHNRGMSPAHLSAAFQRRLLALVKQECTDVECSMHSYDTNHDLYIYTVVIENKKTWLIYPQFLNAKTEAKDQIFSAIKQLVKESKIKRSDHLAILCDHWYDRTRSSKTLYHWWTGNLPEVGISFNHQGIHNLIPEDNDDLAIIIQKKFQLACINRSIFHPLETTNKHALLKYFLCFALFECSTN